MSNTMQTLHSIGLNPFAVQLLAESMLKSAYVQNCGVKPLTFEFPVRRSDCEGWAGVRITIEAVPAEAPATGHEGSDPVSAAPILRRLFDLPLGARFRYQGKPTVYVLLSYADSGLVGDNPTNGGLRRPFQGLYSAAESRAEFEALMVEFVPVVEATGQEARSA